MKTTLAVIFLASLCGAQIINPGSGTFSYPAAGIPNSTGSSWSTSYTTSGSGSVLALAAGPTFTGTVTFSGNMIPPSGTGASKPATCSVGQVYFATDATAGQNWYFCTATNTWTQQLNSGGAGGLSGMTAGQIPVAATATTVTSSVAVAGGGANILEFTPTSPAPNDVLCYNGSSVVVNCTPGVPVTTQATGYTVASTDRGSQLDANSASAVGWTLPQAGTTGFASNFNFEACNLGAGALTITPTTSTINGASTLVLQQNQCASVRSDNSNYYALVLGTSFSGTTGKVATTSGTLTSGHNAGFDANGNIVDNGAAGGGTPAGTSGQLQYNNAGAFGGAPTTVVLTSGANKIPSVPVAGTTYLLTDTGASYTQSAAVALSAGNVTIRCTDPAVVVQFTGATDGFDVTSSGNLITGCTLDHNAQTLAGTGPLINQTAGDYNRYIGNIFQNLGTPSAQIGAIAVSAGNGTAITGNRFGSLAAALGDSGVYAKIAASTSVDGLTISGNSFYLSLGTTLTGGAVWIDIGSNSAAHLARASIDGNRIWLAGTNANGLTWNANIASTGYQASEEPIVVANNVIHATARINDCGRFYGFHHASFTGNQCYINSQTAVAGFDFGDAYFLSVSGGGVSAGSSSGVYGVLWRFIDFGNLSVSGIVADGANANSPGLYLDSTAGISSDSVFSGGICKMAASQSGPCIEVRQNAGASFTHQNNLITGWHIVGDGTASQVGISLVDASGTYQNDSLIGNTFYNLPTGISTGAGVTGTLLLNNTFATVTTPYSLNATGKAKILDLTTGFAFASLPANVAAGSLVYSTDATSTCAAGSSTGTTCFYNGSTWAH